MTIWGERISAALAAIFAIYMMSIAWNFPANGDIFPKFCGFASVFVGGLMILRTFTSPRVFEGDAPDFSWWEEIKPLVLTAGVVIYVNLFFVLGYYVTSALFLVVMAWLVGVRSVKAIAITAIVTFPLMYVFFELFLNARMPRGFLV
jgi:hypothetical protein